jgi:SP family sugar:H+ symporter-like MFS transporter
MLIAAVAAIGGFLFGFDTAVINGAVSSLQVYYHVGTVALGLAVSSALIGSAVGAIGAGRLADRYGRIAVMVVAALLFLVQSFGAGLALTIVDLSIWRFVGGIAVGAASVIAPAYIAESSPAELRGRLGSFQQLAIVLGIFVAALSDFVIATAAGGADRSSLLGLQAWRWMFIAEAIPAIVYLVGALQIPESPRYLVARGRIEEARHVLAGIVGDAGAARRAAEIGRTVSTDQKPSFSDLRGRSLGLLPIVWIGIGLSVLQQFVGINVIFYYSSALWQSVGFTQQQSLTITVITNLTNVVTTLVAIASIDRFGRKPLLLIGSIGMFATLGAMAFLFGTAPLSAGKPELHGLAGPLALVAANAYVFFFGMSWGPAVWVLLGEIFPNRIRAAALGLAAAMQWIANFMISATFPTLASVGLLYAYGIYAFAALLSVFFVLRFISETRGQELESISRQQGQSVQAAS